MVYQRKILVIFFLSAALCSAVPLQRTIVGSVSVISCTISANWGTGLCAAAGSCTVTSTGTHTLTVTSPNSGTIKFATDDPTLQDHAALQYSKNGGAFTTIAENGTVVFANNDTIDLKITSVIAGPTTVTATVTDNTTGATVGTFAATNTHA